ncbi:hypothetical protein ACQBAU_10430 [Propionibacteriaceae bacterium Y2011]
MTLSSGTTTEFPPLNVTVIDAGATPSLPTPVITKCHSVASHP